MASSNHDELDNIQEENNNLNGNGSALTIKQGAGRPFTKITNLSKQRPKTAMIKGRKEHDDSTL